MKNVLILSSSPRRDGNSFRLAQASLKGVQDAGHTAELVHIDDYLSHFLRDCRKCRGADGECSLTDRYQELFVEKYLQGGWRNLRDATLLVWHERPAQDFLRPELLLLRRLPSE